MKKLEKHTFGPQLTHTLEKGDVMLERRSGRLLLITGKKYHVDLSISYLVRSLLSGKKTSITERTFLRNGGGGFERLYRVPRKIISTEGVYPGAMYPYLGLEGIS